MNVNEIKQQMKKKDNLIKRLKHELANKNQEIKQYKETTENKIHRQTEYYFAVNKHRFFRRKTDREGWIAITDFLEFNQIKALKATKADIIKVANRSNIIQIESNNKNKIRSQFWKHFLYDGLQTEYASLLKQYHDLNAKLFELKQTSDSNNAEHEQKYNEIMLKLQSINNTNIKYNQIMQQLMFEKNSTDNKNNELQNEIIQLKAKYHELQLLEAKQQSKEVRIDEMEQKHKELQVKYSELHKSYQLQRAYNSFSISNKNGVKKTDKRNIYINLIHQQSTQHQYFQQNVKSINGTTFYVQQGDNLEDWEHLKVSPEAFVYNKEHRIIVCGECDFSLSACIVMKCGGDGSGICCTCWYYKSQWYKGIQNEIGPEAFLEFLENLEFCKKNCAMVTFGIDAKVLAVSDREWNKNNFDKFDRVVFTFPRIYDEKKNHQWNKSQYHKENEMLLRTILKSAKGYLSEDGEIHIMLLKGQFFNFNIRNVLQELDLQIAFWSELNQHLLHINFNGYIPRDGYGNAMKIDNAFIHFCSFKKKQTLQ